MNENTQTTPEFTAENSPTPEPITPHQTPLSRLPIVLGIIFVILLVAATAYYLGQNAADIALNYPSPTPIEASVTPMEDKIVKLETYINKRHGFTLNFPEKYEVPSDEADSGYLGEKIYFSVSDSNPLDCLGDCPVTEEVTRGLTIAGEQTTKVEGYIGEIGGNIAQRYVKYIFPRSSKFYTFTLYALSKNTDASEYYKNKKPGQDLPIVQEEDIKIFEQILSTFKFIEPGQGMESWETYTNAQYNFSLKYPMNYKVVEDKTGWPNAILLLYKGGQSYDFAIEVWDSESEYQSKYYTQMSLQGLTAKEYQGKFITLFNVNLDPEVDQILSTFQFTDAESAVGKFCGGIAAIQCPSGYTCNLDGNYPDAGGTCQRLR